MKDDLFNFDESLAGGFDTPTNDYEAQLKKARILCIRGRFDQALAICESILDEDMENMGAYIEILRVHTEDFTVFEGKEIEKDIHAIERLFPDIENEEYVDYLQKRNKFLKEKENKQKVEKNPTPVVENNTTTLVESKKNNNISQNLSSATSKKSANGTNQTNSRKSSKSKSTAQIVKEVNDILLLSFKHTADEVLEAKKTIETLAENGEGPALFRLAFYYHFGYHDYPKSEEKAYAYLKKGADLNSGDCLYTMANWYESGEIVEKNLSKAFECYKKAADFGDDSDFSILAIRRVAERYRDGIGVKKDNEKAAEYLKKYALKGKTQGDKNFAERELKKLGYKL